MENKKVVQIELCPICGAMPVMSKESMDYGGGQGYPGNFEYSVFCPRCSLPPMARDYDIYDTEKGTRADHRAVEQWNENCKFILNQHLLNNTYLRNEFKKEEEK